MAVSTSTSFNNGIVGIPQVGADVDIFQTSSTPKYAVGQRFIRSDGNEYVYSHFGVAVSSGGLLVATDASQSHSAYATTKSLGRIYASASTTAIAGETIRPGTKGSHYVEIKAGDATADEYAGGYFQTILGAGGFYEYRIRGNTASTAKTSGAQKTYYLELYEPIQQTLDGTTGMRILGSKFANLLSSVAATDAILAGATTCSHAAASYGWVRTLRGVVGIRTNNAPPQSIGSAVATVAGFVQLNAAISTAVPIIGYAADVTFAGAGMQPVDCYL